MDGIPEKIVDFFTQFKQQSFKKGEILIRADDNPVGIYFLKDGIVKMYVISKKGEELVLTIFKPGSFFPMFWAINNTRNMYYFEAMTNVIVYRAPKEQVVDFVKGNIDVLYDLLSRMYKGLDGLLIRMAYLMSGNAYNRLIAEILIGEKRFGKTNEETGEVMLIMSEKDLATSAGMTRETVSREMKILKEKGLVVFAHHSLLIKDVKKLEAELSGEF